MMDPQPPPCSRFSETAGTTIERVTHVSPVSPKQSEKPPKNPLKVAAGKRGAEVRQANKDRLLEQLRDVKDRLSRFSGSSVVSEKLENTENMEQEPPSPSFSETFEERGGNRGRNHVFEERRAWYIAGSILLVVVGAFAIRQVYRSGRVLRTTAVPTLHSGADDDAACSGNNRPPASGPSIKDKVDPFTME